ncbi:Ribosomal biogenesis protein las1l [Coelomomyces lativittatus]|nr:Ribosomal biogenesis protein las1l [Coelomomyces lativittatus]
MRIARIVPWTGQEEWDQVSQWLYSEDPDLRLYGVNRVTAWLGRGRVPNAVTSTSMFVHIIYQDQLNTLSELALRSLYTLAIVRFVNGMVDVEQTKVHAQAVSLVAEKLGIPLWLVDLRHAGTHDRVPSLHYLRLAADFVLQWLFDNYWQCQPYGNELEDIKDRISKEIQAFTPTYLSDSLMLEKLVSSISNEHGLEILISSLLTPGVLMPKDPKDCPSFPKLFSSDYIDLWSPLFLSVYISYPSFLERFMNSLIASLVEVSWEASSGKSYFFLISHFFFVKALFHFSKFLYFLSFFFFCL